MPPSASQPGYKQSYVASPHDLHRRQSKAPGPTMLLSWQNEARRSSQTHGRFGRPAGVSSDADQTSASAMAKRASRGPERGRVLVVQSASPLPLLAGARVANRADVSWNAPWVVHGFGRIIRRLPSRFAG
jgi:hypothetical protein